MTAFGRQNAGPLHRYIKNLPTNIRWLSTSSAAQRTQPHIYRFSLAHPPVCFLVGHPYMHSRVVPSNVESPCPAGPQKGRPRTTAGSGSSNRWLLQQQQLTRQRLSITEKDSESWPFLRPANYTEPLLRSPLVSVCAPLLGAPIVNFVGFDRVSERAPSS